MGKKILIVDDEPTTLKLFSMIVSKQGYTVIQAINGIFALEALEMNPDTAFIFCDYQMPEMDGKTLINKITSNFSSKLIKSLGKTSFLKLGYFFAFSK